MDIIEDLPFEGDPNQPLPADFMKKSAPLIEYNLKLADTEEYILPKYEGVLARYIALGQPQDRAFDLAAEIAAEEANRVRLDIEIEAIRKRALDKKHYQEKVDAVYHSVDLMLEKQLEKVISKPLKYFCDSTDLAHLRQIFADFNSTSTSALASLIEPSQWLSDEYIKLANSPSMKNIFGSHINTDAKDIRQAINFLGVKGCRMVLPKMIIERYYKKHGGLNKPVWQRLIKFQQMSALAAYRLAKQANLDATKAYLISAMSVMAEFAFTNLYTHQARLARQLSTDKAKQLQDDFRMSLLDEYQPKPNALVKLFQFSPSFLPATLDSFTTTHLPFIDIIQGKDDSSITPWHNTYKMARGFAAYRLLAGAKQLAAGEASELIKQYGIDKDSLEVLKSINFAKENVYQLFLKD